MATVPTAAPAAPRLPLGPDGGRPFRGWRALASLTAAAVVAAGTVVMLADRAPAVLGRVSRRIDASGSRAARVAADARLPESDFEIHLVLWATAAVLVGLAAWSWRSLAGGGIALLAYAQAVELGQGVLTAARQVQLSDAVANAVGVAAGVAGVAVVARVWAALARRPRPRPQGGPTARWRAW